MPEEFSPKQQLAHSLGLWWLIALTILAGGLLGYVFHHIHPPIYQAHAVISTFIEYQAVTDVNLSEYDEDITINTVENVLLSNDVLGSLIQAAGNTGIPLDYATFMKNMSIDRRLADYDLFYRDRDPAVAQQVLNAWVQIGVDAIHRMQSTGNLPRYLTVNLSATAELPQAPYFGQTNSYVLAGAIVGLIAGLLLSTLPHPVQALRQKGAHARQGRRQD